MKCQLCGSDKKDDVQYGEFLCKGSKGVHTFCLYLTSNLRQNGKDNEGFLGFLLEDIEKEKKRVAGQRCYYCSKGSANIHCCKPHCYKTFHLACGLENGVWCQFVKTFRSFCHRHVFKTRSRPNKNDECCICLEPLIGSGERFRAVNILRAPCCRNGWFHKICLQGFAKASGYFYKCPLCNNQTEFNERMRYLGIFIPKRDAEWELEPNAFEELLERPQVCSAKICHNPSGRSAFDDDDPLLVCRSCGSQASHRNCLRKKLNYFECNVCQRLLSFDSGHGSENSEENNISGNSVPVNSNSADNIDDQREDNEINVEDLSDGSCDDTRESKLCEYNPNNGKQKLVALELINNTLKETSKFTKHSERELCSKSCTEQRTTKPTHSTESTRNDDSEADEMPSTSNNSAKYFRSEARLEVNTRNVLDVAVQHLDSHNTSTDWTKRIRKRISSTHSDSFSSSIQINGKHAPNQGSEDDNPKLVCYASDKYRLDHDDASQNVDENCDSDFASIQTRTKRAGTKMSSFVTNRTIESDDSKSDDYICNSNRREVLDTAKDNCDSDSSSIQFKSGSKSTNKRILSTSCDSDFSSNEISEQTKHSAKRIRSFATKQGTENDNVKLIDYASDENRIDHSGVAPQGSEENSDLHSSPIQRKESEKKHMPSIGTNQNTKHDTSKLVDYICKRNRREAFDNAKENCDSDSSPIQFRKRSKCIHLTYSDSDSSYSSPVQLRAQTKRSAAKRIYLIDSDTDIETRKLETQLELHDNCVNATPKRKIAHSRLAKVKRQRTSTMVQGTSDACLAFREKSSGNDHSSTENTPDQLDRSNESNKIYRVPDMMQRNNAEITSNSIHTSTIHFPLEDIAEDDELKCTNTQRTNYSSSKETSSNIQTPASGRTGASKRRSSYDEEYSFSACQSTDAYMWPNFERSNGKLKRVKKTETEQTQTPHNFVRSYNTLFNGTQEEQNNSKKRPRLD